MKNYIILPITILCFGCNTVNIKPNSLDTTQTIYSATNGDGMLHYFKDELNNRGYDVTVGTKTNIFDNISSTDIKNARYITNINEFEVSDSMLVIGRPLCIFNGWKWVDFNMSITDNKTGKEILNWSGMGCKNYAIEQMKYYLDVLEQK